MDSCAQNPFQSILLYGLEINRPKATKNNISSSKTFISNIYRMLKQISLQVGWLREDLFISLICTILSLVPVPVIRRITRVNAPFAKFHT